MIQQRYNLSDLDFDFSAFYDIPWGYDPDTNDEATTQPFAAEDIIIVGFDHPMRLADC